MTKKKTLILDTSAFFAGFDPFSVNYDQFSVPLIEKELESKSLPLVRFKEAVNCGKLKLKTPSPDLIDKIKDTSELVGDVFFLSPIDIQILALALDRKTAGCNPVIVTDDYSIQNVAQKVGIDFTSITTFGIRSQLNWIRYCPACHSQYPPNYQFRVCETCGTALKRKPQKPAP